MFKQLSAKELSKTYSDRPWINKNALTNLFLSAFAEAVIPAMDKAMEKLFKILSSTEFIAKLEEDIVDESISRVIDKIKNELREDLIKGMLFDD
ncbi:MAG: hypothetical protein FK730_12420 [Asgard group archaeon]|nr:hypothetical protein [Asgard group archaeon]